MPISAILFDLDGTLLDTLEDIADAANAVLASQGMPTHSLTSFKLFVGEGVWRLFEKALPEKKRDAAMVTECAARFNGEYGRRWDAKTRPYDGIPRLLRSLAQRQLPLAVLSNKPQAFTEQCVGRYFPDITFARVLGQRDGIPPKPDPAGAMEITSSLALPPQRILYLGDSSIDMQTAVRAGMYPVGALWGFRSRDELLASGAAQVIERPENLLELLDSAAA